MRQTESAAHERFLVQRLSFVCLKQPETAHASYVTRTHSMSYSIYVWQSTCVRTHVHVHARKLQQLIMSSQIY